MSLHIWKRFLQGKEVCEQPTFNSNSLSTKDASKLGKLISRSPCHIPRVIPRCFIRLSAILGVPLIIPQICGPPWEEVDEVGSPPSATLSRRKAQGRQPQSCGIITMTLVLHHSSWKESSQTSSAEGLKSGVSCGQRAACLSVSSQKNPVVSLRPGESPGANLCG